MSHSLLFKSRSTDPDSPGVLIQGHNIEQLCICLGILPQLLQCVVQASGIDPVSVCNCHLEGILRLAHAINGGLIRPWWDAIHPFIHTR